MKKITLLAFVSLAACTSDRSNVHFDLSAVRQSARLQGFTLDVLAIRVNGPGLTEQVFAMGPDDVEAHLVVPAGAKRRFSLDATHAISDGSQVAAFAGETIVDIGPGAVDVDLDAVPAGEILLTPLAGTTDAADIVTGVSTLGTDFTGEAPVTVGGQPQRIVAQIGSPVLDVNSTYLLILPTAPVVVQQGQLTPVSAYVANVATRCNGDSVAAVKALAPVCQPISVIVAGLPVGLVIELHGPDGELVDTAAVDDSGNVTFANGLPAGSTYTVVIATQPAHGTCTLQTTGELVAGNDSNVVISCDQRVVYADVVGLPPGSIDITVNVGGANVVKTITSDGLLALTDELTQGTNISASITRQPDASLNMNCVITYNGVVQPVVSSAVESLTSAIRVGCALNASPYYENTTRWDEWVVDSDAPTAALCDTAKPNQFCRHAGAFRKTVINGLSDCTGVVAFDALNAFDWSCVPQPGALTIIATGFKQLAANDPQRSYYLRRLINIASATPGWIPNSITVTTPKRTFVTGSTQWWNNPIDVTTDGTLTQTTGHVIVQRGTIPYGVSITGSVSWVTDSVVSPFSDAITVSAANRVWVELGINSASAGGVTVAAGSSFIELRGISAVTQNAAISIAPGVTGVHVADAELSNTYYAAPVLDLGGSFNRFERITVSQSGGSPGFAFGDSGGHDVQVRDVTIQNVSDGIATLTPKMLITNVRIGNVGGAGITINAADVAVSHAMISNAGDSGINVLGNDARLSDITVMAVSNYGISNGGLSTVIEGATLAFASGAGLRSTGSYLLAVGVAAWNNYVGIDNNDGSSYVAFVDTAAIANTTGFATIDGPVTILGNFLVSATTDCTVTGTPADPGIVDRKCTASATDGSTDFEKGNGTLHIVGSNVGFVGLATLDSNPATVSGQANSDLITDWVDLDNRYRGFVLGNGSRGPCQASQSCQVFDARLTAGSPLTGKLTQGVQNQVWQIADASSDATCASVIPGSTTNGTSCSSDIVSGAIEAPVTTDGVCNGGETCAQSVNIGSYAGEEPLEFPVIFDVDGASTTFFSYTTPVAP